MQISLMIQKLLAGVILTCSATSALALGISAAYGTGSPSHLQMYRVSLSKDWQVKWLEGRYGYIGGYFDFSLARYKTHPDFRVEHRINHTISIVPMFRLYGPKMGPVQPFLEGGIGPSVFQYVRLAQNNLSTQYQFDDRIGAGVRFPGFAKDDRIDVVFNINHLSNGGIKKPNNGVDVGQILTLRYWFDLG